MSTYGLEQLEEELRELDTAGPHPDRFAARLESALLDAAPEVRRRRTSAARFGKRPFIFLAAAALLITGGAAASGALPRISTFFRELVTGQDIPSVSVPQESKRTAPSRQPVLKSTAARPPPPVSKTVSETTTALPGPTLSPPKKPAGAPERLRPELKPPPPVLDAPRLPAEPQRTNALPQRLTPELKLPEHRPAPTLTDLPPRKPSQTERPTTTGGPQGLAPPPRPDARPPGHPDSQTERSPLPRPPLPPPPRAPGPGGPPPRP